MIALIATQQLPLQVADEAREACRAIGLDPIEWLRGIPRTAPVAIVGGLAHGERRIPEDLVALLEATPDARLVLCVQEPLIRTRVVLADGRVCLVAPPVERGQIAAALRGSMAAPAPRSTLDGGRFEALRRTHWAAWTRGRRGPSTSLHGEPGATIVLGAVIGAPAEIARALTGPEPDLARVAALAPEVGVAHLDEDGQEWTIYWSLDRGPLWLCSPNRLPTRWDAGRAIAASGSRLLRLAAFPGDQVVGAWSTDASRPAVLAPAALALDGGCETLVALDEIAERDDQFAALVLEAR
jgi:hypothetical protein